MSLSRNYAALFPANPQNNSDHSFAKLSNLLRILILLNLIAQVAAQEKHTAGQLNHSGGVQPSIWVHITLAVGAISLCFLVLGIKICCDCARSRNQARQNTNGYAPLCAGDDDLYQARDNRSDMSP